MIEGSGSGSWRPKNMWIRWIRIRIRNTDLRHCIASFWNCLLVILSQSMQYYVTRPHWKWFFFLRRSILLPFMLCEPVKPSRLLRSSSNVSTVYWVTGIWCVYVKLSPYSRNVCTWWLMWSWWTVTQLPWAHPTPAEPGPTARYHILKNYSSFCYAY